tara:strand:- start:16918 stop:17865 length:948 start_codon:yes stop_codon:yes gene_type:complete
MSEGFHSTGVLERPQEQEQSSYSHIQASGNEGIDLVAVTRKLLDCRKFIAIVGLLGFLVSVAIALAITPTYKAEITVAPVSENDGSGKLSSTLGNMGLGFASNLLGTNGDNKAEIALATIKSRAFLFSFMEDYDLLPVLFPKQWDAKRQSWKKQDPKKQPTLFKGHQLFVKKILKVTQDKKTGLVAMSIEWRNPQQAAQWANILVQRLNDQMRAQAIVEYEKQNDYLAREVQKTSVVHVQEAMFHLIETQTKEAMLANVTEEFAFKIIDPAIVPEERSKPKRKLIVAAGSFLGLFLGCFLVFANDFRQQVLRTRQ